MDNRPPIFDGYSDNDSVITFIDDFEQYVAARTLAPAAQLALIRASLRGPAKEAFAGFAHTAAADQHDARVEEVKEWMRVTYHTDEVKQGLKDQLENLYQEPSETPRTFYNRIRYLISIA